MTAKELWAVGADDAIWSSPAVMGNRLYFVDGHSLFALG